jgi:hypothetical protein
MPDSDTPNPNLETIPVLVPHLETLLSTLERALNKSMAEDLVEHYRTQRGRNPQQSAITTALDKAVQRVAGYLGVQEDYE